MNMKQRNIGIIEQLRSKYGQRLSTKTTADGHLMVLIDGTYATKFCQHGQKRGAMPDKIFVRKALASVDKIISKRSVRA